ncbi:MAG: PAS domain-containing protein [Alphaproteobacteria bacterium]|nr:PAS domain-containing protein [Alphaproteobacteria bacterium]
MPDPVSSTPIEAAVPVARLHEILESISDAFYALDAEGRVTYVNARALQLWNRRAADLLGRPFTDVFPQVKGHPLEHALIRAGATRTAQHLEAVSPLLNRWVATAVYPSASGGVSVYFRDIDQRRRDEMALRDLAGRLEERVAERTAELAAANARLRAEIEERTRAEVALRQAQKMEAIGQLTGGIAHDFNNRLQAIAGALQLLRRRLSRADVAEADVFAKAALAEVERAAALIRRLLAFGRQRPMQAERVEVNALIGAMMDLVRRSVGAGVRVETELAEGLWPVECDANQLENALLNLCINARDAMPEGGRLVIATANATLTDEPVQDGTVCGDFVAVRVADSGIGMPPEVRARVFDPFFTTKPPERGTGLGLAMLYGFVRQAGGHVRIDSGAGTGTTVTLWLPRAG